MIPLSITCAYMIINGTLYCAHVHAYTLCLFLPKTHSILASVTLVWLLTKAGGRQSSATQRAMKLPRMSAASGVSRLSSSSSRRSRSKPTAATGAALIDKELHVHNTIASFEDHCTCTCIVFLFALLSVSEVCMSVCVCVTRPLLSDGNAVCVCVCVCVCVSRGLYSVSDGNAVCVCVCVCTCSDVPGVEQLSVQVREEHGGLLPVGCLLLHHQRQQHMHNLERGKEGGSSLNYLQTMYIILYRSAHNSVLVSALLSDLRTDTHIKFQKATQYIEMKPTKQCSRKCHDNNNMHN